MQSNLTSRRPIYLKHFTMTYKNYRYILNIPRFMNLQTGNSKEKKEKKEKFQLGPQVFYSLLQ